MADLTVELDDRVSIVTGGATGIGRAISSALASRGAKVVVNFLPEVAVAADEVVEEIRSHRGSAIAVEADIGNAAAVRALIGATIDQYDFQRRFSHDGRTGYSVGAVFQRINYPRHLRSRRSEPNHGLPRPDLRRS